MALVFAHQQNPDIMLLQNFQVITDHSPLVLFLNSHCLEEIKNFNAYKPDWWPTISMQYSAKVVLMQHLTPFNQEINTKWCTCKMLGGPYPTVSISEMSIQQSGNIRVRAPRPATAIRPGLRAPAIERHHVWFPKNTGHFPDSYKCYW